MEIVFCPYYHVDLCIELQQLIQRLLVSDNNLLLEFQIGSVLRVVSRAIHLTIETMMPLR